jgi:hypothetical protein
MNRAPGPALQEELEALEERVGAALEHGDAAGLEVLGYGEISSVLGLRTRAGPLACKRLPVFADGASFERYAGVFFDYLDALAAAGVRPLSSDLQPVPLEGGRIAVYCVQPRVPAGCLGPSYVRGAELGARRRFARAVTEGVVAAVDGGLGIDAQLSNWALLDGEVRYLDVTTPLLRDAQGNERLDVGLFIASLPWILRGLVRRFLLAEILSHFYSARAALLDLAANLIKERMEDSMPLFLEAIEGAVSPPLTEREVRAYYRSDARMWALLQRLRRMDRWWQRRVRRRPYPFLLPGHIER